MDEQLELVLARWCARRVLPLWDAPEVVREWLDTGEGAAEGAAGAAAWAAEGAAEGAAAERAAARAAAWAERAAERSAQQHARALITTLATLLPEHGLSALRLDEALEDRWLTREVWRVVMEREVEVQVPVLHDDGTTTYRTEIVRVVVDWDVVRGWAEVER